MAVYIVLYLIIIGLGVYVFVCPKQATKKENRDDAAAVAKNKKSGGWLAAIGIIVLLLTVLVGWKKEVDCTGCSGTTKVAWYSNRERNFCDECTKNLGRMFENYKK